MWFMLSAQRCFLVIYQACLDCMAHRCSASVKSFSPSKKATAASPRSAFVPLSTQLRTTRRRLRMLHCHLSSGRRRNDDGRIVQKLLQALRRNLAASYAPGVQREQYSTPTGSFAAKAILVEKQWIRRCLVQTQANYNQHQYCQTLQMSSARPG